MTVQVSPREASTPRPRQSNRFLRAFLRQRVAAVAAVVLLLIVIACYAAPILAPYDPLLQELSNGYALPSPEHLLGTDRLGRDVLSRLMFGGIITLTGALVAVLVTIALGVLLGLFAAAVPKGGDAAVLRICDLLQSIPGLIILLVVLAVFNQNETAAMVTLGILLSAGVTRVVRGAAIAVREELYVAAARVAGLNTLQMQSRHILPAIAGPVLTQISVVAAAAILVESSLGFLGLGVVPPTPTWGNMVSEANQSLGIAPWLLLPAGATITIVTLTLTLVGNGFRDAYAGRSSRTGRQLSWRSLAARASRRPDSPETETRYPNDAHTLLSIRDLTVEVPVDGGYRTIVDNVSLDVAPGASIGIVGESGCGKSMTVLGILRVLPPGARVTATRALFDGLELLDLSEKQMSDVRGTGIAYISQEPISSLDPAFTAGQQLTEAIRQHRGGSKRAAKATALELLTQVRLPDPASVYEKYPHQLSGGMAQRVAIARALAGRPRLLIADEPTTALDVTVQADILDLLRDLRMQTGMAVILVTHDWGVLADACDDTIVMYAGQVVEAASTRDQVHLPLHPYSQGLLLATPANIVPGERLRAIEGVVPAPGSWPTGCRFAARCEFAQQDCREAPIPLLEAGPDRTSRCIHIEKLLQTESEYARVTIA